jgi:hypothetical protein
MTANNLRSPSEFTYGLEHVAIGAECAGAGYEHRGDEGIAWYWPTHLSGIFFILESTAVIETHNRGNAVHVNIGERYDVLPSDRSKVLTGAPERRAWPAT